LRQTSGAGSNDKMDIKILEAVGALSSKSFVSPIKVYEILKMDASELGNCLAAPEKSGCEDVMTCDYASGHTLQSFISKVRITEIRAAMPWERTIMVGALYFPGAILLLSHLAYPAGSP